MKLCLKRPWRNLLNSMAGQVNNNMVMEAEALHRKATRLSSDTTLLMVNLRMLDIRLNHPRLCNTHSLCKASNTRRTLSLLQLHRPVHRRHHPNTILMHMLHSADSLSIPNISHRKWEPRSTTHLLTPTPQHEIRILLPSKQLPIIKARGSYPSPTTPLLSTPKTSHRASRISILEVMRRHHNMRRLRQDLLREATRHSKDITSRQGVHPDKVRTATCPVSNNRRHRVTRHRAYRHRRASALGRSNTRLISRNSKQGTLVGILASSIGSLIVSSHARSRSV